MTIFGLDQRPMPRITVKVEGIIKSIQRQIDIKTYVKSNRSNSTKKRTIPDFATRLSKRQNSRSNFNPGRPFYCKMIGKDE